MANFWNKNDLPHKGWILLDVEDIRGEDKSEDEADYETCMMCGQEKIRYVHIVKHPDVAEELRVGCICASKLTDDYVNPKRRECELQNYINRKKTWNKKKWKNSPVGNPFRFINGQCFQIVKDYKSGRFKLKIDKKLGDFTYDSIEDAKKRAFEVIEHRRMNRLNRG